MKATTRTVDGRTWTYNDATGNWLSPATHAWESGLQYISRSSRNQSIWLLWNGNDEQAGQEFKSMTKAMRHAA
jgi:hypothetical protein